MTHDEGGSSTVRSEPLVVVDLPCETGEGPLWHEASGTLFWVDIPAGTLYRYEPVTGMNGVVYQHTGSIGGYTLQEDDSLVLFGDNGEILLYQEGDIETIVPQIEEMVGSRFNDVIADPEGRVYCGTMPLENSPARLYRLDPDGSLHLVFDDLTLSNGMGFSPDLSTFYHTDTESGRIFRMRYDRGTGALTDRDVLIQVPEDEGGPDGMTVDAEGTIWSARWGGRGVFHYSPEGELIEKVELPVTNVTSIAFGGHGYDVAYITSGGGQDRDEENGILAGSLFQARLGATGCPPFRSRIGIV